jgi:hypothetical protein
MDYCGASPERLAQIKHPWQFLSMAAWRNADNLLKQRGRVMQLRSGHQFAASLEQFGGDLVGRRTNQGVTAR